MPRQRKRADRRQGHGTRDVGRVAVPNTLIDVPAPAKEWLVATRERWNAYWASDVARIVDHNSDMPALRRLFGYYDEIERAGRAFRRQRLTLGSASQIRLNPIGRYIGELDGFVRALEDRFGLTPMARLKLGVEFGNAHRSLEEIARGFDADDTEPDPRLTRPQAS